MEKVIFWGAGRTGMRMLDFWQAFGAQPDFFADNAPELWGRSYHGITVLPKEEILKMKDPHIVITCNQAEEITAQLLACGISGQNISRGNTVNDMLKFWAGHRNGRIHWDISDGEKGTAQGSRAERVLFDVQAGFVLGGVETWSGQMGGILQSNGLDVKYLTTDSQGWENRKENDSVIYTEIRNCPSEVDKIQKCLTGIRKNTPCNIVCNFPFYNFQASCIAKMLWPEEVNLIAVVHNDVDIYYSMYSGMERVIDSCLVISSMTEEKLVREGFPKEKIRKLCWNIPCETALEHHYSRPGEVLRLGYAGRVTVNQKRMDLLLEAAGRLNKANIRFLLEIAGTGDYLEKLNREIEEENLQHCVRTLGYVENERMGEFWLRQDVAVSCSDFEGHSISQGEAMAAGAVPVTTDVSGAGDYVQDGYNGYVVPVGGVNDIVDKIRHLYFHRELLGVMGRRSHQIILKQNAENEASDLWDRILK